MRLKKNSLKDKGELPIFFRYLKEKGVYKSYFEQVKRNHSDWSTLNSGYHGDLNTMLYDRRHNTVGLIDMTLNWRETQQGEDFWRKLDEEYSSFLTSYKNGKL